jgi:nucleoside-diphosphate-sugar epimerase
VVAELQARAHRVRGFDRVRTSGLEECICGDLGDRGAVDKAMTGVDCLIHLAATPDDADFLSELLPANIVGFYYIMEAARLAGVRRIVLASSGQVNWWQEQTGPWPIRAEDPPSPRYWYAATKMFMEAIGRGFAEMHWISVIVARLGWCPRTPEQVAEITAGEWAQDVYLSPGDAGRFFACCVEAPETIRHAVVFATSKPARKVRLDLAPALTLLGYAPRESWPQGVEVVVGQQPAG